MNNTTRNNNQTLIVLTLLTTILVTGIFTVTVSTVFADSRILKLDTKQNATCDTVGADSPISNSCNQKSTNNANNRIPNAGTPGTLLINERCIGQLCSLVSSLNIIVTGNNPQPSSFSFTCFCLNSQLVSLGPGSFKITESPRPFVVLFTGDCMGSQNSPPNQPQATGSISAGQHLTCNIVNLD